MTKQTLQRLAFPLSSGLLLLAVTTLSAASTNAPQQDPTFRLMTIERRLDQMQQRLDFVERNQQTQTLNAGNTRNYNNDLLLEIQRQQLSLAQQTVELQQRMLEMQKTIDRLSETAKKAEPTTAPVPAKSTESAKPKPTPRKP